MTKIDTYNLPDDLYYPEKHTWARVIGKEIEIGRDAYGADKAGKILFVDLPKKGDKVQANKPLGHLEADKFVGEIISPVSGEVVEVNDEILANVEQIKEDSYGRGWLIKVKAERIEEIKKLIFGPKKLKEAFADI